jgi:hypothetical protein
MAEMTIKADSANDPYEFGAPLTKCKHYGREKALLSRHSAFAGDGQREGDGRAEADSRLGADLPAVGFDQALGYSQPEPGASGLGAGHRQEAMEEAREIFRGNAAPRVGDGD